MEPPQMLNKLLFDTTLPHIHKIPDRVLRYCIKIPGIRGLHVWQGLLTQESNLTIWIQFTTNLHLFSE